MSSDKAERKETKNDFSLDLPSSCITVYCSERERETERATDRLTAEFARNALVVWEKP